MSPKNSAFFAKSQWFSPERRNTESEPSGKPIDRFSKRMYGMFVGRVLLHSAGAGFPTHLLRRSRN